MFTLFLCGYANDDESSDIKRQLIAEGYEISETLELESDDLKKLGEDVARSFLLKEKEILDKYKKNMTLIK